QRPRLHGLTCGRRRLSLVPESFMRFTTPSDDGSGSPSKKGFANNGRGPKSVARFLRRALTHPTAAIHVSPLLTELATVTSSAALERLGTSPDGLSEEEATRRLEQHGPNVIAEDGRHGRLRLFARALLNPLVLLLAILALISVATGDARAAIVMAVMIVLGV